MVYLISFLVSFFGHLYGLNRRSVTDSLHVCHASGLSK